MVRLKLAGVCFGVLLPVLMTIKRMLIQVVVSFQKPAKQVS